MRDIMRAVRRLQRQGDALGSNRRVADARSREQLPQDPVDVHILCDDPPSDRGEEIASGENDVTGGIGVDDASDRIDNAYPRAEAIEGVGEARGLPSLEIEKSADQHRPANVRNDETHALAHFIVDNAL